jgi:hypothetical protein
MRGIFAAPQARAKRGSNRKSPPPFTAREEESDETSTITPPAGTGFARPDFPLAGARGIYGLPLMQMRGIFAAPQARA